MTKRSWLRNWFTSRKPCVVRKAQLKRQLYLESLEERVTPASLSKVPVNFENGLQFRLLKSTDSWTMNGNVYSTSAEVLIGLQGPGKFQPVLAVENGVALDTIAGHQSFTITKPVGKDNFLDYFPVSFNKLSHLWEFKESYIFQNADLQNLVNLSPGPDTKPVSIGGTAVVPLSDNVGLKINGNLGGSTLVPSALLITRSQNSLKVPELNLTGRLSLNVGGKIGQALIKDLHIKFGDNAQYTVKADAVGLVQLVSKTGSGIWADITPDPGQAQTTIGSVQVELKYGQFRFDPTTKTLSITARLEISLKDDANDATPFQIDLGDQSNPGLTLNFSKGIKLTRFQAAFVPGTQGGASRASFTLAGATVTLDGLFFLYDGAKDLFGVGGVAQFQFGQEGDKIKLVLGNPKQNQAGLTIADGNVKSFTGRVSGTFHVKQFALQGDVFATYQAADGKQPSQVTLSGSLTVAIDGFSATVTMPAPGLVIRGGEFDLPSGFGITLNGGFDIKGFDFQFNNLQATYSLDRNSQNTYDDTWTLSGGATLSSFFNASVDLTNGGLIIRNGAWDFEGIKVHIANLTAGGFGLQDLLLQYHKTADGKDYEVKVSATLALGLINVGAEFDIKDGHLSSIGVDFKAAGEDPGLPIGDTGLFITELGFEVDNLDHLSQWVFQGTVAIAFGEGITYEGKTVRLFSAEGHFKADSNEFDLDQADFSVMDGYLAQGSGTMLLNWGKHIYHVGLDVSGFDGLITLHTEFDLNQFDQITALADLGIQVPAAVPFIGGDKLADIEGLLYFDHVDPSKSLVAGWIDINTYIFGHWRIGIERLFLPAAGQDPVQVLWGSDVEKLEQEATSLGKGYLTTFSPKIKATDPAPNQSLFTYEWQNTNEVGKVTITVPDDTQPDGVKVVIPQGTTGPVKFTVNGKAYVVQAVKELSGERRFAFMIGPDTSADPNNILTPLPTGQYTVEVDTAEMTTGKLTHAETYAPPEIKAVTVKQPSANNLVTVQTSYVTADPANTSIDLYYSTDPDGGAGTFLQSIPLTDKVHLTGTVTTTWKIDDLPWKQPLYVFARASDVATDQSGHSGKRTGSETVAATSVTPYADLTVQLNVSPGLPLDSQPETLSGWPVLWQQLGTDGKTVIKTVHDVTDSFGQAGITANSGTNWTLTVAPKSWDGFAPLPAKGQTGDASGQLITTHLSGGSYRVPRQVIVNFQAQISIHGQVSLDLTGDQAKELGGAGLASELVYADLNKNGQLDAGEPRTMSDVKGYYDLRFPLPTATTTYTIRLLPEAGAAATFVRTTPDSKTNYSFVQGASYNVTVNPNGTHLFDSRDFLLQQQVTISGFAYTSGPDGASFGLGSVPVPDATIHLVGPGGNQFLTTTSAADGSYHFTVLNQGQFEVYTDQQHPAQVNTPGRHALSFNTSQTSPSLALTTPDGYPLYQINNGSDTSPVTVSADFFGDGGWDMATLGWSPHDNGLYLVILKGGDSPAAISASSILLTNNFQTEPGSLPGVSWSHASNAVIVYFTDHALSYSPVTNALSDVSFPDFPPGITQIAGFTSDGQTNTDAWLLRSADASVWTVLTQNAVGQSPYSTFDFTTGLGIRPFPVPDKNISVQNFARVAMGDFDGDGVSDLAFAGVNTAGRNVIAYLLSRERGSFGQFTQVHTLLLGPTQSGSEILSVDAIPLSNGKPGASTLSMLAVHEADIEQGTAALAFFLPQPASGAAVVNGSPAASFLLASTFPFPSFTPGNQNLAFSTDIVADMNGDGYQDLVGISAEPLNGGMHVAVFLNNGEGQFSAAEPVAAGQAVNALFTAGLISAGSETLPGSNLPSVLALADNNTDKQLNDTLILATNTTRVINSYLFQIDSPGSYGGYNFGFVNADGQPTNAMTGTAYLDANQNGRQDPGEQNLVGQRIQASVRDASGNIIQQILTTDETGKFTVTTPGTVVIQSVGLFPGNSEPAHALPTAAISLSLYTRAASAKLIQALYQYELNREASATEVDNWVGVLNGLGGRPAVVSAIINSTEAFKDVIVNWFETYLSRSPDNNEINDFVAALANQTEEQVLKTIVGSDEFYNRAQGMGFNGTPDQNYVRALYQSLLGRTASSAEVDAQVNALQQLGKEGLSLGFLQSVEYRSIVVAGLYTSLLGRPGSTKEIDSWVASSFDIRLLRMSFELTPEFFTFNTTILKVGGQGIVVGGSSLVQTLDYGDTFTLGVGTRPGIQPNQPLTGDELDVEYHAPTAPKQTWSSLWQISDDLQAIGVTEIAYPGTSRAGSEGGFLQAAGMTYTGIEYGLRDQYVVQIDAVQTTEPIVISTGTQRDTIYGDGTLSVLFKPDDGSAGDPGIEITNSQGHSDIVWDSVDGNYHSITTPLPIMTGAKIDTWNNYAVAFDRAKQTLTIYVNQKLLKTLDLKIFADGVYANFSNAAVTVGSGGSREWLDNFQVGAPYVGYQTVLGSVATFGYDFGLKSAGAQTGAIQGAVVLAPNESGDPFTPGLPPLPGVKVYLDLNGDAKYTPGEPFAMTDVHGAYRINAVRPGTYLVMQEAPRGYEVIASHNGSTTVLGGQTAYGINFSDVNHNQNVDFNLDSLPDYVRLVPISSKAVEVRLDIMDGDFVGRTQVVGSYNPRLWLPAGVGDFNNDGHPDLLFENVATREVWYWQLHSGQFVRSQYLTKLPCSWHIAAVGDLDSKGTTDLVLRQDCTGKLAAWLMNKSVQIGAASLGTIGARQVLEGLADVNGDGHLDLVLHDTRSGDVAVRFLNGTRTVKTSMIGRIDPRSHLISSQPWKPHDAAGLSMAWQNDSTGLITRWRYDYVKGLAESIVDYQLGNRNHAGSYLTYPSRR